MGKKAVVIGSGFGGIAISLRLKKLGYDTTIIEKLDELGGRARVFEVNGFKHDAGPTVITCLLYTSPSPRDSMTSRMPSSA